MMRTIRRINSAGNTEISRTQKICDYCLSILLSLCVQALELCESAQQKKSFNTRHELWCFTYQFNHRLKIGILNKHITLDCPYLKFTDQKVETHFKSLKGANGLKCHYYLLNSPRWLDAVAGQRDLRPNWYQPLRYQPSPWKVVTHHWGLRPHSAFD